VMIVLWMSDDGKAAGDELQSTNDGGCRSWMVVAPVELVALSGVGFRPWWLVGVDQRSSMRRKGQVRRVERSTGTSGGRRTRYWSVPRVAGQHEGENWVRLVRAQHWDFRRSSHAMLVDVSCDVAARGKRKAVKSVGSDSGTIRRQAGFWRSSVEMGYSVAVLHGGR
jgi:hypothetical protein